MSQFYAPRKTEHTAGHMYSHFSKAVYLNRDLHYVYVAHLIFDSNAAVL